MARILIVDDNADACEANSKYLSAVGHEVVCVPNGREALTQVLIHLPDVVLLDLLMPEMDGPSFLEVVRSYLRLQSLPVVVLTALVDSPMIDRAQALKVNSILVKGKASAEDIQKAIEEAIVRMPGSEATIALAGRIGWAIESGFGAEPLRSAAGEKVGLGKDQAIGPVSRIDGLADASL